jgi:hypothetical protein
MRAATRASCTGSSDRAATAQALDRDRSDIVSTSFVLVIHLTHDRQEQRERQAVAVSAATRPPWEKT